MALSFSNRLKILCVPYNTRFLREDPTGEFTLPHPMSSGSLSESMRTTPGQTSEAAYIPCLWEFVLWRGGL